MINLFIITSYKQNKLKTLGFYCKNYLIITSTVMFSGRG